MPDTQPVQQKPDQPFENVIELQSEQFLRDMEQLGVILPDRALRKEWAKDKLRKGFPLQIIEQSLKANKYDFDVVGKYLDTIYKSKQQAETAIKEVKDMKDEKIKTEKDLKKATHLSWIVAAFMTSAIGGGMSIFLKGQTKDIGLTEPGMEMASDMLSNFIKGGWVICIAAGLVGLLLGAFALNEYLDERKKKKQEREAAIQNVQESINTQISPAGQSQPQNPQ
ncbi:MAG: hypothetical protein PHO02_06405 [Candidatus Nanoarchaeia archaeon]|nr:hypothetical protein [Candidatus Nanoarchaeia archaeon]